MTIKTGCDIVYVSRFQKSAESGNKLFLNKVFSLHELSTSSSIYTLAGFFAAKEAVIKALELGPGEWQKIEITKDHSGRPRASLNNIAANIINHDISISHDGDYAMAVAIFLISD